MNLEKMWSELIPKEKSFNMRFIFFNKILIVNCINNIIFQCNPNIVYAASENVDKLYE